MLPWNRHPSVDMIKGIPSEWDKDARLVYSLLWDILGLRPNLEDGVLRFMSGEVITLKDLPELMKLSPGIVEKAMAFIVQTRADGFTKFPKVHILPNGGIQLTDFDLLMENGHKLHRRGR